MERTTLTRCAFIAALIGALIASGASAATLYRWVDEAGVTHYGEKPPPGANTSGAVPTPMMAGTTVSAARRQQSH